MGPSDNYKVFNEDIEFKLKELGELIGKNLPEGWGFSLLLFDFNAGDNGSLFYTSNGLREDLVMMMKEFIALDERERKPKELPPGDVEGV